MLRLVPSGVPKVGVWQEREPAFQAFSIMRFGYTVLPIIAGADKFFHLLTNWNLYLAAPIVRLIGGRATGFMDLVGLIEIAAGIVVAIRPREGGVIVGLWLIGIIINLFLIPGFFDIALRDLGLCLGAFALSRLSAQFGR